MNPRLLEILVCPLCKGPLVYDKAAQELICKGDRLAYPIRDDIPIMWADQARDLNDSATPLQDTLAKPDSDIAGGI